MDNFASLLPGRNPTGSPIYSPVDMTGVGSSSGVNPLMPPVNLPSGAPRTNVYDPSSIVPTFGANTGGGYQPTSLLPPSVGGASPKTTAGSAQASPIGGMNLMSNTDISRMYKDLKATYGDGIAHAMLNFLSTGAGFNQAAINNLFAAQQPGIERGTQSLMEQFSTSGNRFGSGAQIGLADYLSQVQLNQGQLETQMYETSIQDFMQTLMGTGATAATAKANSPSFLDKLGGILNIVGAGAGAASAAGVGGTAGTILDVIGSLAGAI